MSLSSSADGGSYELLTRHTDQDSAFELLAAELDGIVAERDLPRDVLPLSDDTCVGRVLLNALWVVEDGGTTLPPVQTAIAQALLDRC
ncbi:hypothetical protein ABIA33_003110 [Streptacidiphilus sp. MAP12-16]|uniref:hypothetical protein n=1 Tax=Streptacidiphilus sp. MAP12-16 TaxID=3156300 RepID=UPI003518BC03